MCILIMEYGYPQLDTTEVGFLQALARKRQHLPTPSA